MCFNHVILQAPHLELSWKHLGPFEETRCAGIKIKVIRKLCQKKHNLLPQGIISNASFLFKEVHLKHICVYKLTVLPDFTMSINEAMNRATNLDASLVYPSEKDQKSEVNYT